MKRSTNAWILVFGATTGVLAVAIPSRWVEWVGLACWLVLLVLRPGWESTAGGILSLMFLIVFLIAGGGGALLQLSTWPVMDAAGNFLTRFPMLVVGLWLTFLQAYRLWRWPHHQPFEVEAVSHAPN